MCYFDSVMSIVDDTLDFKLLDVTDGEDNDGLLLLLVQCIIICGKIISLS